MNLPRSILAATFVCLAAGSPLAQGKTFPDGTVSPFDPGFFRIGIPEPATNSYVFGVTAQAGTFVAAVGQINGLDGGAGQQPAFWAAGNSYQGLPRLQGQTNGGTVSAISADGKIKVGDGSGGAVYWDANNEIHLLDAGAGDVRSNVAAAITPDGSKIAGSVQTGEGNGLPFYEACLWSPGIAGLARLGILPGFTSSVATGISENGQAVCGYATVLDQSTTPSTFRVRAFLYEAGQMKALDSPAVSSTAYAVSEFGGSHLSVGIVGTPGNSQAALWLSGDSALVRLESDAQSAAYAIRAQARAPSGALGRIVGTNGTSDTGRAAFMWNRSGHREGTIKGLLASRYGVSIGEWHLFEAYALSADGYTIGGVGFNPTIHLEGWIAVLPPILHPPVVQRPANQISRPGDFGLLVSATNDPTSFSARGLPPGFSIDNEGRISGFWSSDETAKIGTYTVTVTAANIEGTGTTTFKITLALPPGATSPEKSKSIEGHGYLPQNKPPGEQTFLASFSSGITPNGQVAVGHDGFINDSRAYRWTAADGPSGLPMLDGALRTFSTAMAVSADGNTIVGQASAAPAEDGSNRTVATVWRPAAASNLKAIRQRERHYAEREATAGLEAINLGLFPGGIISIANGVSADGSVVVGYGDGEDPDPNFGIQLYQAFRWTQSSGLVGLGWIDTATKFSQAYGVSADGSIIVGVDAQQAFRWTETAGMVGLGKAPGATRSRAVAVSADNSTIIGFNAFSNSNDANRAFRWTAAGGMTDLGVLPGDGFSEARALSADGSIIVGQSGIRFVSGRAFIWDQTNGMRDLKQVLVAGNPGLANWTLTSADGISADGKTVTGWGTNPNGDFEGYTAVLEARPAQLLNISTRMRVLAGDKVLIGGFIITGTDAKKVMVRGMGPSLGAAGVQGAMADPTLELHQGSATIASNDNWKQRADGSSQEAEIVATTIPPANNLESALVVTLNPGAYTAILVDKNNGPGVGLVEVYDLAQQTSSKLANISTRGFVDTGDNVMIGGFIAGGGTPGASSGEVIRAIGPSLASAGVTDALLDPTLELYNGNGVLLARNDDWKLRADGTSQEAEINATTIAPSDNRESALAITLAPGSYTAVVRGKNGSTGVSLVEVYHLQ